MNAIMEVEITEMELKYCERCGGLWLRPRDSEVVFCGACANALAGLRGQRNKVEREADELVGRPALHTAFWAEGGNA